MQMQTFLIAVKANFLRPGAYRPRYHPETKQSFFGKTSQAMCFESHESFKSRLPEWRTSPNLATTYVARIRARIDVFPERLARTYLRLDGK